MKEHLEIFGTIKGIDLHNLTAKVIEMADKVSFLLYIWNLYTLYCLILDIQKISCQQNQKTLLMSSIMLYFLKFKFCYICFLFFFLCINIFRIQHLDLQSRNFKTIQQIFDLMVKENFLQKIFLGKMAYLV